MIYKTHNILLYIFLIFFIICNLCWILFDPLLGGFQYNIYLHTLGEFYLHFAIDGISLFFIYLTSLLISLCLLFTINSKTNESEKNNQSLLVFCIGILLLIVFSAADILLFYISFESILIPFFIYIGVSGYRIRRIHAAYLFFFYTIVASWFMLLSIFSIYLQVGSTDIEILWNTEFLYNRSYLIWAGLFITFAVKIPMWPFHIWLPEAHVEAPTEGSVLLAGLLLKLGIYGFLRFSFPVFPELCYYYSPIVITLSSIGIVYSSLSTLRQIDIKRVVAYSSIAHMNMCMLGLFSFNELALIGSMFLMIAHGIVSGGLFFVIGMLYNRYHTKTIYYLNGIVHFMPILSCFFLLLILGNIAMPATSNFVGEFLILCGITYQGYFIAMFNAAIGIFLCTVYSMWLYNKIIFLLPKFNYLIITDLYIFEIIILITIAFIMLIIGIYPKIIIDYMCISITNISLTI